MARLINRQLTLRQPFFAKDKQHKIGRKREDDVYGGMFISAQEAKDDGYQLHGKQNKTRGTKHKRLRRISRKARKANRGNSN